TDGGATGNGGIFAVQTDGTGFTNLYSFTAVPDPDNPPYINDDGATPSAGLILSDNTLYGTTQVGGHTGAGTIFAINTDGTGFTSLHTFSGGDGANPYGALILTNNTLYGTASSFFAESISLTTFGSVFSLSLGPPPPPRLSLTLTGANLEL